MIPFDDVLRLGGEPSDERWLQVIERERATWERGGACWTVLPHEGGFVVVSIGTEATRRMIEVARSFLGPMVDVVGSRREIISVKDGTIERITVAVSSTKRTATLEALLRMSFVRSKIPRVTTFEPKAVPVMLRDLHLALAVRDAPLVGQLLERLEQSGGLSGENLRFLELQRDAVFDDWTTITAAKDFNDLCVMRRPQAISEILAEALWRRDFLSLNATKGDVATRSHFVEQETAVKFGSLLQALSKPSRPLARLLVAVHNGCSDEVGRMVTLTSELPDDEAERLWSLSGLSGPGLTPGLVITTPSPVPLVAVTQSVEVVEPAPVVGMETDASLRLDCGDYIGVIDLYVANPGNPRLAIVALEAASELANAAEAKRVVGAIIAGGVELPQRQRIQRMFEDIRNLADGECTSWMTWAARIVGSSWTGAFDVLVSSSEHWALEFLNDPVATKIVAEAIVEVSASGHPNSASLRAGVGALVRLASAHPYAPGTSEVRTAVLMVMSDLDSAGDAVCSAVLELLRTGVEAGWPVDDARDAIAVVESIWQRAISPRLVPWIIEVLEAIALLQGLPVEERDLLFTRVGGSLVGHRRFIDPVWFDELKSLLAEVFTFPSDPTSLHSVDQRSPWNRLDGRRIGFYSLDPGVRQIVDRVGELVVDSSVQLVSAHVWNDALANMVTSSDVLVVQTGRAKHAATGPIRQHAIGHVIWSRGVSPRSLLRELEKYADTLPARGSEVSAA